MTADLSAPLTEDEKTALHVHVEDQLIEMRDSAMSMLGCANGLVVRNRDASPSDIIRIGTRMAVTIVVEEFQRLRQLEAEQPGAVSMMVVELTKGAGE
jgi:hypothetical protein